MVAIKAHQANSFLNPPGPKYAAVLFYGSDAGLIAERAQKLAALVAARDSGEIVRLDDADLDTDPDRFAVELQTIPMFGGSKVVRATAGRRINAAALQPLLEGGTLAATLIVEAGNLKPSDFHAGTVREVGASGRRRLLRRRGGRHRRARRETLGAHGLSITSDARELLVARMGADRAMSRGEIEKLGALPRLAKGRSMPQTSRPSSGTPPSSSSTAPLNAAASQRCGTRRRRVLPRRRGGREPADDHPGAATLAAAAASDPDGSRCRHILRGGDPPAAAAGALQAEGRHRAAMPHVDLAAARPGTGAHRRSGQGGAAQFGARGCDRRRAAYHRGDGSAPEGRGVPQVNLPGTAYLLAHA
ncbi:MAG: hypothetical protein WDN31_00430 [Hyphomicrobium sp.]